MTIWNQFWGCSGPQNHYIVGSNLVYRWYYRSDAQAWLSCHFNVHEIHPSPSFAYFLGMLKEISMPIFSSWKGVEGGRKTVRMFFPYFVLKCIGKYRKNAIFEENPFWKVGNRHIGLLILTGVTLATWKRCLECFRRALGPKNHNFRPKMGAKSHFSKIKIRVHTPDIFKPLAFVSNES